MRLKKFICLFTTVLSLSPLAAQEVVSNHSVSVELAGLMYAYECPLGDRFSLVTRVGTQAGIQYASYSSFWGEREHRWSVGLYPVLSVEPRYYYNLSKRYEAGKNAFKNSGGFLSCNLQYYLPPYYRRHVDNSGGFVMTPFWGFRRVWYRHLLFELGGGLNLASTDLKSVSVGPAFNVRLGYLF